MPRKPPAANDLDDLQRNSWQLELLVTGFALAAMISGWSAMERATGTYLGDFMGQDTTAVVAGVLVMVGYLAYYVTTINFFAHVVLRCLWIGAIGSRSVMGNTVFARRPLAPVFRDFLRRRTGNFDRYIQRLDDAASLIFAVTFLLIAITVSLVAFLLLFVFLMNQATETGIRPLSGVLLVVALLYVLGGLLYLLDFLTGSYFKRFRGLGRIYYPVYRFFGWVTLARIYRPLYYNLLNRRGGRRLIAGLIPYLTFVVFLTTLLFTASPFVAGEFLDQSYNSAYALNTQHYDDIDRPAAKNSAVIIPSQTIREPFLRVRLPLLPTYTEFIEHACPELNRHYSSALTSRLFSSGRSGSFNGSGYVDTDTDRVVLNRAVLDCLASPLRLYLNDGPQDLTDVLLADSPDNTKVELIKFIALDSLSPGLHRLRLDRLWVPRNAPEDSVAVRSSTTVPFYYAPER